MSSCFAPTSFGAFHSQIEGLPSTSRFVFSPTAEVEKRLLSETAELKLDISNLNKKLNYLETTYRNSQGHIDRILHSGGRPWRFLDLEDSQLGDLPENYESTPLARYYRVSELRPRRITGYKLKKKISRSLDLDPMKRMYPGVLLGRSEGNIYDLTSYGVGLCMYNEPPLVTF